MQPNIHFPLQSTYNTCTPLEFTLHGIQVSPRVALPLYGWDHLVNEYRYLPVTYRILFKIECTLWLTTKSTVNLHTLLGTIPENRVLFAVKQLLQEITGPQQQFSHIEDVIDYGAGHDRYLAMYDLDNVENKEDMDTLTPDRFYPLVVEYEISNSNLQKIDDVVHFREISHYIDNYEPIFLSTSLRDIEIVRETHPWVRRLLPLSINDQLDNYPLTQFKYPTRGKQGWRNLFRNPTVYYTLPEEVYRTAQLYPLLNGYYPPELIELILDYC